VELIEIHGKNQAICDYNNNKSRLFEQTSMTMITTRKTPSTFQPFFLYLHFKPHILFVRVIGHFFIHNSDQDILPIIGGRSRGRFCFRIHQHEDEESETAVIN